MPMRLRFSAICFDCDSTLTRLEGIDELARRAGCFDEIADLTNAAMDGRVALEDVYAKRLDLIRPDRAALAWLGARYGEAIVPGAKETIAELKKSGAAVYVVSGGLVQAVAPFAATLGVEASHVHAVAIDFDSAGAYCGFDTASPLARGDGKAVVCRTLAARHGSIAIVGDGVTDLAARDGGAYVIGFGGVVERQAVKHGADYFASASSLTCTLDALCFYVKEENS